MIVASLCPQRLPLDQLHDKERRGGRGTAVDGADDVGVIQLVGGPELLLETPQQDRVRGRLGGQHLEGDQLTGLLVTPAVNLTHSTGAKDLQDVIVPERSGKLLLLFRHG